MKFGEDELVEKAIRRIKAEKRVKDSRLFEVVEEVFDYPTLMALYKLINDGVVGVMHGAVASGKEARIYWAETPSGEDLAVKIFLVQAAEFRRTRLIYIEGDPRFKRAKRLFRRDLRSFIELWCSKEFRNLKRAYEAGVRVPKPYAYRMNVLVMEFISDPETRGRPAPLLKDFKLENPLEAFNTLKRYVELLYSRARLVHADLSEYNVMVRNGELVLIDFGSGVDAAHPLAHEFLKRDIRNLYTYFKRLGVEAGDPEDFYQYLVSLL